MIEDYIQYTKEMLEQDKLLLSQCGFDEGYKKYCCSYKYQNSEWSFNIWATSFENAQQRLKCIGITGRVDGELFLTIPVEKNNVNFWRKILNFITSTLNRL